MKTEQQEIHARVISLQGSIGTMDHFIAKMSKEKDQANDKLRTLQKLCGEHGHSCGSDSPPKGLVSLYCACCGAFFHVK